MTDDHAHQKRAKGRSASICAATSASMDNMLPPMPGADGTPVQQRRRRPAVRSQSARIAGGRSVRKRAAVNAASAASSAAAAASSNANNANVKNCSSEPKLDLQFAAADGGTPDVSPNIRRKGSTTAARRGTSVYHRKSAAFLDVPDNRSYSNSNNANDEDEDSYRLRSFSFNSKGKGIINRGDSFRRRRSRSNSLCPTALGTPSPCEDTDPGLEISRYRVALLGTQGVGKTALISQFMTSECINAYDGSKDMLGSQSVSIMLNGEESELTFENISNSKDIDRISPPDAFVILYSVVDKASYLKAEGELARLQDAELLRTRPAVLVGNKVDLARSRAVSTQDGKCLACTFRAKFVEISVGINHNVDELLVGILTQIRLKSFQNEACDQSQQQWFKSRGVVRASMKARQMFTWLFGKEDSKFKNCENLHIL